MINFHRQFIRPGQLCFDIGANEGERTSVFLAIGARIVAAEPQQKCFVHLQKKFTKNPNVHLVQSAVASAAGEAELLLCDETNECATFSQSFVNHYAAQHNMHWSQKVKVRVTTLDQLIKNYGLPHFCKIDVEGYEGHVLRGLSQPIPVIMLEFNRPLLSDTRQCIQILSQLGNYRLNFITYENMHLALPEWQTPETFLTNLDQIIPENILTGEIVASL